MGYQSVCCGLYITETPMQFSRFVLLTLFCICYMVAGGLFLAFLQGNDGVFDSWISGIYCTFSVLTTIGWGNIAPTHMATKLFLIVYALFGIPLFGLYLYQIQLILEYWLWLLYLQINYGNCEVCDLKKNATKQWQPSLWMVLILVHVYVLLGVTTFSYFEHWSAVDSLYYTFISLTTIGFGDIFPEISWHSTLFYMYILIGLAILGLLFERIQQYWTVLWIGQRTYYLEAEDTSSSKKKQK